MSFRKKNYLNERQSSSEYSSQIGQSLAAIKIRQADHQYMVSRIGEILNTFLQQKEMYEEQFWNQKQTLKQRYEAQLKQKNKNISQLEITINGLHMLIRNHREQLQKAYKIIQDKDQDIRMLRRQVQNKNLKNLVSQISYCNINTNKMDKSRIFEEFTPIITIKQLQSSNKDYGKIRKKLQQIIVNNNCSYQKNYTTQRRGSILQKSIKIKAFDLNIKGKQNNYSTKKSQVNKKQHDSIKTSKQKQNSLRKSLPQNKFLTKQKLSLANVQPSSIQLQQNKQNHKTSVRVFKKPFNI